MRHRHKLSIASLALVVGALAFASGSALAGGAPKCDLTTPGISCLSSTTSSITLQVCGTGTCGAPAGFSIHLKTKADYDANGWVTSAIATPVSPSAVSVPTRRGA